MLHLFHHLFLSQQDILNDIGFEFPVNKYRRDVIRVEMIRTFCTGDDRSDGNVSLMIQKVTHQITFTRITATYQYYHGSFVLIFIKDNPLHVEFFQL